jgi:hypothetical protein
MLLLRANDQAFPCRLDDGRRDLLHLVPPWSKIARICSSLAIFKRSASSITIRIVASQMPRRRDLLFLLAILLTLPLQEHAKVTG